MKNSNDSLLEKFHEFEISTPDQQTLTGGYAQAQPVGASQNGNMSYYDWKHSDGSYTCDILYSTTDKSDWIDQQCFGYCD